MADNEIIASACDCSLCVEACRRYPGWMSLDDAEAAIKAGYAKRLTLDYVYPDDRYGITETIYALIPGIVGYEGERAPELESESTLEIILGTWTPPRFRCTFFNDDGRCSIHDSGFKPIECRTTLICKKTGHSKMDLFKPWATWRGHEIVLKWMDIVGFDDQHVRDHVGAVKHIEIKNVVIEG